MPNCVCCNRGLNHVKERSSGKYCDKVCMIKFIFDKYIEDWKAGRISGTKQSGASAHIRRYLFLKYENKCCECSWDKVNSVTGKVPLEVEHVDGDYTNNQESNLKLLCPNCHALTPTYKGLNRGNGRHARVTRYNEGKSY